MKANFEHDCKELKNSTEAMKKEYEDKKADKKKAT